MKNNKWILGAAGLLVALLAGVVIFLKSIDFNEYKPLISEQVREATGRDLVIGGDISLELGLHTRLAVEQVTLSNARWGSEPVMVRLQRIEAEVALLPLLGGDVQIGRLVLMRPEILLERGADGMGNWEFRGAGAEADADAGGSESDGALPAIHRVLIEEARLTYREGADSEARQLEIKRFEASAESLSDPLALRVEGELDGQPVGLDGEVSSIDTLLGGEPTRLDVRASQGARELALEGELRIAEDAYSLMDAIVSLDGNSLKGGIEYRAHGERGRIEGSFAFDTLDLRGADAGAEAPVAESTAQAGDKVFSGEPLDLQALRSIDGEITLKGNQLLASNLAVNEIDLALLMEGGLLRFTPRSLVVGGGRISGTGELDARGERATLNIKLDGEGLGLGKMLAETGVNDLITDAVTRMQIRLKGSGGSVAALLGSLSGRVLVDVGRGKVNNEHLNLSGADLVSELLVALNPFAKKELLAAE